MERSETVERFIQDVAAAVERGDIAFIESITSREPGVVAIGTDPGEYARGYESIIGSYQESTPEGSMEVHHGPFIEIRGYEHGDVAWADGIGSFVSEGKSVHVRLTSVLLRQEGKWRAVQAHYSIGVPNDHMFDALFRRPRAEFQRSLDRRSTR